MQHPNLINNALLVPDYVNWQSFFEDECTLEEEYNEVRLYFFDNQVCGAWYVVMPNGDVIPVGYIHVQKQFCFYSGKEEEGCFYNKN